MKNEINYAEKTCYDYKTFTVEDYIQYKDILESMPYSPELAEFFHQQKRVDKKCNMQAYRHAIVSSQEALENSCSCKDFSDDAAFLLSYENEYPQLTAIEQRRLKLLLLTGGNQARAAELDGAARSSFYESVCSIRKKFENLFQNYPEQFADFCRSK